MIDTRPLEELLANPRAVRKIRKRLLAQGDELSPRLAWIISDCRKRARRFAKRVLETENIETGVTRVAKDTRFWMLTLLLRPLASRLKMVMPNFVTEFQAEANSIRTSAGELLGEELLEDFFVADEGHDGVFIVVSRNLEKSEMNDVEFYAKLEELYRRALAARFALVEAVRCKDIEKARRLVAIYLKCADEEFWLAKNTLEPNDKPFMVVTHLVTEGPELEMEYPPIIGLLKRFDEQGEKKARG